MKWNDTYYLRAFELAKDGFSDSKIASCLGISPITFTTWKQQRPALRDALERARKENSPKEETFADYVYNRLPDYLQELWDKINLCDQVTNGIQRMEALLSNAGKTARQHLFTYALVKANFSISDACRSVNISRTTYNKWVQDDPLFSELMDEIHWHKGNFFEAALVERVKEGDSACTIFANRTFNKERGYGAEVALKGKVEHTHSHLHAHIKVDELDLPIETRRQLLAAVQKRKELPIAGESNGEVRSTGRAESPGELASIPG